LQGGDGVIRFFQQSRKKDSTECGEGKKGLGWAEAPNRRAKNDRDEKRGEVGEETGSRRRTVQGNFARGLGKREGKLGRVIKPFGEIQKVGLGGCGGRELKEKPNHP